MRRLLACLEQAPGQIAGRDPDDARDAAPDAAFAAHPSLARLRLEGGQAALLSAFVRLENGKPGLKSGPDGYCVFFRPGRGCCVHQARPDICRAWPFFRGNLADGVSYALAAGGCPGINRAAGYEEFRRQGLRYLREHGLAAAKNAADAPNALKVADLF